MPIHEYECTNWGQRFELRRMVNNPARRTGCGSDNLEQPLPASYVVTAAVIN